MVKDRIFILVLIILIVLGFMENNYIVSRFEYFGDTLNEIISLAEEKNTDTEKLDDLIAWWKNEKTSLHSFIPHYDIKDIDGMMVEAKNFIKTTNFDFATTVLRKLQDNIKAIPQTYTPLIENIF